jgi:aryl-alcohol dehydrogenase-like predicted oxidoreductase
MQNRIFGRTGIPVSEIGLGTWQLGGVDWGAVDESKAFAILQSAIDHGINFVDTADVYGLGVSEQFIGKFLKSCPKQVFVATKLGRRPEPGWPENFTLKAMRAHTELSLKNLGVDCIDLSQLHCIPTEVFRAGEVFENYRVLQQEGKIKYFGASVESMEEAMICMEQDGCAALQIIFNIFRQKPIFELFDKAKANGVALIIRLPLASGLLSGRFSTDTTFPEKDHRNYNKDGQCFNVGETFAGLPFEKGVELAEKIKALVPEGMTMAQMALRWILDYDAVSTIIPGASRPEQVVANASAGDLAPLSQELHDTLKQLYTEEIAAHIRGKY